MSGFGDRLRQEREAREITLRQIADETKIGMRYLLALEADDLQSLPGTVFNKGYVRTYAEFVGVDPEPLVQAYMAEEKLQSEAGRLREADLLSELARSIEARQTNRRPAARLLPWALGLAGVAVLLIGAAGWYFLRPQFAQTPRASAAPPPARTVPVQTESRPSVPAVSTGSEEPQQLAGSPESTLPAASVAPRTREPEPTVVAQESVTEEPAVQEPAAQKPTAQGPVTQELVTQPAPVETSTAEARVTPPPAPVPEPARAVASSATPAAMTTGGTTIPEYGIGTGVEHRRLVGRADTFESGAQVWFWTRVMGGHAGQTIRHVWIHDGREILSTPLTLGGPHWRTQSRKTLVEGAGDWAVEARDADGNVLARETFTCLPQG